MPTIPREVRAGSPNCRKKAAKADRSDTRAQETAPGYPTATMCSMAATSTRATKALDALGVGYVTHTYEVDEEVGSGYGEAVAVAIGLPAKSVFKTLVAEADGQGVVAIIPVSMRLSTKSLAKVAGAKRCALGSPELAERLTGYVVGGVSPFGQRRTLPTFIDDSVSAHPGVAVSGGRRGLQLEISPDDLLTATGGTLARLTA